jgi:SnoaL-like polyketide cyclase.
MAMSSVSVAEANIATFRRAIEEGWNKGNLEAIDELFVPDFVEHQVGIGPGRDAVKGSIRSLRIAFPDLHLTFEDVVAECASMSSTSSAWPTADWSSTGASRTGSASPSRSGSSPAGRGRTRLAGALRLVLGQARPRSLRCIRAAVRVLGRAADRRLASRG